MRGIGNTPGTLPRGVSSHSGAACVMSDEPSRTLAAGETPQNPLRIEARRWTFAIRRTDTHSLKCRHCNRKGHPHSLAVTLGALTDPALEAYQLCPKAITLREEEVGARKAYLALGGVLPVGRTQ